MNAPSQGSASLAHKIQRLGHLDIPGGGQVVVQGKHAFLGHMKPPYGTTILDISDPRKPRVVAEIKLETDRSHTHKVRVAGDIMVTNVEHNNRRVVRAPNWSSRWGASRRRKSWRPNSGSRSRDWRRWRPNWPAAMPKADSRCGISRIPPSRA
jgi:hypothetical protein